LVSDSLIIHQWCSHSNSNLWCVAPRKAPLKRDPAGICFAARAAPAKLIAFRGAARSRSGRLRLIAP